MGAAAASLVLVAAISWLLTLRWRREDAAAARSRLSALALLSVAAAGAGSAAVEALVAVLPAGSAVPARTAVLAAAAVGLAALRVRTSVAEAGWLAWGVLGGTALKLFVQDLPQGRPASLFAAFVLYGLALLAVSRLGRRARP